MTPPPRNKCQAWAQSVDYLFYSKASLVFYGVTILTCLTLLIYASVHDENKQIAVAYLIVDNFITLVLIFEVSIRIAASTCKEYVRSKWNWVDLVIVTASVAMTIVEWVHYHDDSQNNEKRILAAGTALLVVRSAIQLTRLIFLLKVQWHRAQTAGLDLSQLDEDLDDLLGDNPEYGEQDAHLHHTPYVAFEEY
eukprot:m.361473 g.361473  ORF g.361473 m.361473 type:complete len:194 (+) comp19623_c0_seq1:166-747(+)